MEQAQSSQIPQVKFSVATRLLIGLLLLLVIFIVFLNVSTVLVLSEDKKNYTYQQQSTEGALAGNQFFHLASASLDVMRQALGTFDPKMPIGVNQKAALDALIQNQNEVIRFDLYKVNSGSDALAFEKPAFERIETFSKLTRLKDLGIETEKVFEIDSVIQKEIIEDLKKTNVSLQNASTVGTTPLLAIVYSEPLAEYTDGHDLVAIGFVSLKTLTQMRSGTHLSIANKTGWVLYDTDATNLFSKQNVSYDELFKRANASKVTAGAFELTREHQKVLGSFFKPGLDLVVATTSSWADVMEGTVALVERFIVLGVLAIGAAILFGVIFSRAITAPLNQLFEATKDVSTGKFDLNLKINRSDEIGALSGAFEVMSKKIGELIQEKLRQSALENELKIASTVQQTLIPESAIDTPNLRLRSYYQPAAVCGGDWWGFFTVDNRSCILIADATGHGLPSALITASIRSCFSMIQKMAEESSGFVLNPAQLLSFANRAVFDAASGRIMMTLFAGVFDHESKTFSYANAGHNPPWLFKKQANGFKLQSLVVDGRRLGEMKEAHPYASKQEVLNPGDIFFFYTDGLIENTNAEGNQFTKKRALKLVQENLIQGDIQGVIDHLTVAVNQHNGQKMYDDDVTYTCIEVRGAPSA